MSSIDKLQKITARVLDPVRPAYSLKTEIDELKLLFAEARTFARTDDIAGGETRTADGVAISPTMASMCLDDFARTVQFIRGTHNSIADLRDRIRERPIRVLYAGCGPWATLAVPLMSVYSANEVKFTLLDIHRDSIESAKTLIDKLELTDRVDRIECTDAANYIVDPVPDIILVEMMRAGLEGEPQVAVARHLLRQAPNAVVIPAEIRLDLTLINASREFVFKEHIDEVDRDRVSLGNVLAIDHETLCRKELPETLIQIPEFDKNRYRPMLCTEVRIYSDAILKDYDAGITCPRKLPIDIKGGDTLQFSYELGSYPGLKVHQSSL